MKKILVLCIIITLISLTGCNQKEIVEENKEEVKENQAIILEDQIVNDLTIENFNISTDDDNVTYIYFDIVNNTENVIAINKITYTLYEDETEVFTNTKIINGPIDPADLRTVTTSSDLNLSDVNNVKYVIE